MLPQPPDGYMNDDQAREKLNAFFNAAKYDPVVLPKRCNPATADAFVKEMLDQEKLSLARLIRTGTLMGFYDLRDRAEQLVRHFERRVLDEKAYDRALQAIGLAGAFGPPPVGGRAMEAYKTVLGRELTDPQMAAAIDTFFRLPAEADAAWVTDALDQRSADLKPRIDADSEAAVSYYQIEDWKEDRLPSVLKACKYRDAALGHKPLERRVKDYARAYIGLEVNAYADLRFWGVMMLQRECNAAEPAKIAAALTEALDLLMNRAGPTEKMPPGDKKDLAGYTTRLTRAIDFYGGILTPEQKKFADENQREQSDVLHWD